MSLLSEPAIDPLDHRHDALVFESDEQLAEGGGAFIAEGLERGEQVVLVCTGRQNQLLVDAVDGAEAVARGQLAVVDQRSVYVRPPTALDYYRRMVERAIASGLTGTRLVAEVRFGDDEERWREWGRYEAICNVALAPLPLWSVCAYDVGDGPDEVAEIARRTHPVVRRGTERAPNPSYVAPEEYLSSRAEPERLEVQLRAPDLAITGVMNVKETVGVRRQLAHALRSRPRIDGRLCQEFVSAVHEVVVNAIGHGKPPVSVRLWVAPDEVVCTVTDHGPGVADPFAGYWRPVATPEALPKSGLWVARTRCDELSFHRNATFGVRLRTRR